MEEAKVCESSVENNNSINLCNHANVNHLNHLVMIEYLSKSILQNHAISKFKYLAIWWKTMYIYMKEIAQYKEDIKKLSNKLHQTSTIQLDSKSVNLPLMPLELLDIIMLELSSLFLILILTSIILWKWIQDYKCNIRFLKWLQD